MGKKLTIEGKVKWLKKIYRISCRSRVIHGKSKMLFCFYRLELFQNKKKMEKERFVAFEVLTERFVPTLTFFLNTNLSFSLQILTKR